MEFTKSQRIVHALQQLQQFTPHISSTRDSTLHVLTGALVSAYVEAEFQNSDTIKIQFAGGMQHEVIGTPYLNLQILESAAHELHEGINGKSPISVRAKELSDHLTRKHSLE